MVLIEAYLILKQLFVVRVMPVEYPASNAADVSPVKYVQPGSKYVEENLEIRGQRSISISGDTLVLARLLSMQSGIVKPTHLALGYQNGLTHRYQILSWSYANRIRILALGTDSTLTRLPMLV